MIYESGYNGKLSSLSGCVSISGRGRTVTCGSLTLTDAVRMLLPSNPKRIAAFIQNVGSGNFMYVSFGEGNTATLWPHESFTINEFFPWTGKVECSCNVGSTTMVYYTEICID